MARLRPARSPQRLTETDDFVVDNNRINIAEPEVFARDPVNLIRLFYLAQKHNLAIHPDAMRLATHSLKLIDKDLRENQEANRLFLEILTSKNDAETVLRRMNEAGVLGGFVRAFGRIVAMMQFNMYHHYTVDEHLLRCIGVLDEIERGENREFTLANELMRTIQPRAPHRALCRAVPARHRQGADRGPLDRRRPHRAPALPAASACRRPTPRLVAWLVEEHLVMSTVAQSRDLSDRKTIENFAAVVQSLERLKLLTILTTADIRAVGPGVWNGWKAQLLRTLYYETEPVLTGGFSEVNRAQRVAVAQAEFRAEIKDWPAEKLDAYIARHYPAYWLKVDLPHKLAHAHFVRAAEEAGKTLATTVGFDAARGVTELTVFAPDHPWLLSIIAGACALAGANIVDAQIYTTTDGLALDTISVSREFERDEDEARRAARIGDAIEQAVRGELKLPDVVAKRAAPKGRLKAFAIEPEVTINNQWSAPLHRGRSHRPRPARPALRTDRDAVEAQPQHRLGPCRDLRRARGRRVLRHRSARRANFRADAPDGHQAPADRRVRGAERRGEAGQRSRGGVAFSLPHPGRACARPSASLLRRGRGGGREVTRHRRRAHVTSRPPTLPSPTRGRVDTE